MQAINKKIIDDFPKGNYMLLFLSIATFAATKNSANAVDLVELIKSSPYSKEVLLGIYEIFKYLSYLLLFNTALIFSFYNWHWEYIPERIDVIQTQKNMLRALLKMIVSSLAICLAVYVLFYYNLSWETFCWNFFKEIIKDGATCLKLICGICVPFKVVNFLYLKQTYHLRIRINGYQI